MYPELSEQERFPMLTTQGRALLHRMRQHPAAPTWNWPNGEQLKPSGLEKVLDFHTRLFSQNARKTNDPPDWLGDFVEHCLTDVLPTAIPARDSVFGIAHLFSPGPGPARLGFCP